jgi:hypothetical protein
MTAFPVWLRVPRMAAFPSLNKKGDRKPPRFRQGKSACIHAKTLSFFNASRTCSIDFGQFAPMFRLDAARYRNAIS